MVKLKLTLLAAVATYVLGSTETLAQNAYIANNGSQNVSVIDTVTNTVIATIPIYLNTPGGVSVTPGGTKVYVTGGDAVAVIDGTTNMLVTTIPTPAADVAVSPDGRRVYVTGGDTAYSVAVLDTAIDEVIATIPVGNIPLGIAVSPDGTKVYVADSHSDSVSVIDTSTNTVIATVRVESFPHDVAVTPDGGRVYVSNAQSTTVSVIDTATNTVIATVPVGFIDPNAGGTFPLGVAVSPDGSKVYVANSFLANSISVIGTATNTVIATIPVGSNPVGVSLTADGSKLYVTNFYGNDVSVIDTATNMAAAAPVPVDANPYSPGIFIQRPLGFAGTPRKSNCYGQSISALTSHYHGINAAAKALGYSSARSLQNTILAFCEE
jgi:YVTN family beta-propeller protein